MSDQITVEVSGSTQTESVAGDEQQTVTETEKSSPGEVDKSNGEEAGNASEQQDDDDEGEESHEGDDVPYGVKKKLGKLTARVKERDERIAARDNELRAAREELEFLRKQGQGMREVKDTPRPTLESANFDMAEFDKQIDAWTKDQAELGIKRRQQEESAQARQGSYNAKVAEFSKDKPDWMEKTSRIPASEVMVEVIQEMDHGPAVTYYLAQHLNEAIDIARMQGHKAALALAKIEDKITSQSGQEPKKSITGAPPPVKTLNTQSPIKKDLAELTMSEYVKERKKSCRKPSGFL
jgi:hypothetical protein